MKRDTAESRLHHALTERVIGVFYDVYNELGTGFLESVYEVSMALALADAGLRVERQKLVQVHFRGRVAGEYRVDLLVDAAVVVELKCARSVDPVHEAQLLNYLRATDLEVGLLLNFGPRPIVRRLVFSNERKTGLPVMHRPSPSYP